MFFNRVDRKLLKTYKNSKKELYKNRSKYSDMQFNTAIRLIDDMIYDIKHGDDHNGKKKKRRN